MSKFGMLREINIVNASNVDAIERGVAAALMVGINTARFTEVVFGDFFIPLI